MGRLLQIGQVAERTGLSLRTIRFYEESGLVLPSGRTEGGFRLYGEDAVARLEVVKRMKPLGLTLDEVRELLTLLDDLAARPGDTVLTGRLRVFHEGALARVEALRAELAVAEDFAGTLAARREATR